MVTLVLLDPEARVVYDALIHMSAYTASEMRDRFGWGTPEIRAWHHATDKFAKAAAKATSREGR